MQKIPRGVWVLGFVSLFMDVSSEMIHAVLPLFIVGTFCASAALLSSLIAGLLWDAGGAPMTLLAGAAFPLLALAGASWVKAPAVEVKAHPSK